MTSVRAVDVAAELRRRLPGLGVKAMHKLLYYCQGHHLAAFDEPLFPESVMAWDMGPVVAQLWKQEQLGLAQPGDEPLDEASLNTIGFVVSKYGRLNGRDLELLSHGEPPWRDANERRQPGGSVRIEPSSMRAYFRLGDDDVAPLDSDVVRTWLAGAAERSSLPRRLDTPARLLALAGLT